MSLLLSPCLALLCAVSPAQDPETVFRELTFEEGLTAAREEGKLLVASFVTADCEDCRRLASVTWREDGVMRWLEVEAVPIEVDGAEHPELAERLGIRAYPTVVLLHGDGVEYDRMIGYVRPARFVRAMRGLLEVREQLLEHRRRILATPDDPGAYMAVGRILAAAERKESALDLYAHVWTAFRPHPEYRDIRLYRVLSDVSALGSSFAASRQRVLGWRRAALKALKDPDDGDRVLAALEVSALNSQLSEPEAMLKTYRELAARDDTPEEVLYVLCDEQVVSQLYNDQEYVELLAALRDPFQRVDETLAKIADARERERAGEVNVTTHELPVLMSGLFSRSGIYFEILLQVGREDEALELKDFVLNREPFAQGYAAMIRAARKAKHGALARQIEKDGLERLPAKERKELEATIRRS